MGDDTIHEELIRRMVNRFLSWPLPEDFSPDGGIIFERSYELSVDGETHQYRRYPSGTNLLHAAQAEALVRHMVGDDVVLRLKWGEA